MNITPNKEPHSMNRELLAAVALAAATAALGTLVKHAAEKALNQR